jgi:hypothetical protein
MKAGERVRITRGELDSLQRQLADGRRPSAKQIETLDTIWERATKRG